MSDERGLELLLKSVFRGFIEERPELRAAPPAIMRRAATLPGRTRGSVQFGGTGSGGPGVSKDLSAYTERELVGLLAQKGGELDLVCLHIAASARRYVGPVEDVWVAMELVPEELGLKWTGKPGDIDILVGPWCGGRPRFDWLAGCEMKRRVTASDGSPKSPPCGFGRTQAAGLLKLGCDFSVLLHAIVAEHRPSGAAATLALQNETQMFGPDQSRTEFATQKEVLSRLAPDVGYAVLLLNHGLAHAPASNGSARLLPYRAAKRVAAREELRQSVRALWERERFEGAKLVRRCPSCADVVAVSRAYATACPACGAPWVPNEAIPRAADLAPLSSPG